ncbi:PGF-CTERM sorting domain-containing protein [Haloferax larsenii]|nr:PGF-CTERM sorting domain-containing protein [Haloferax larsenii]
MMRSSNAHTLTIAALLMVVLASVATPVSAASQYEFTDDAYEGEQGDVIEITLNASADANDTVDVHIGSEAAGFLVHATATDENDDGNVTLALNTSTAGQVEASSYLSAVGNDSVSNATQATDNITELLDAGSYSLKVGSMNNSSDTSVLSVKSNESATDPVESTPSDDGDDESSELDFEKTVITADAASDGVAEIPVQFGSNDTATLLIAADETGYDTTLELTDADGDGDAVVSVDATSDAESPQEYITASDGDEFEVVSTNESMTALQKGIDYDLELMPVGAEDAATIGTLVVEENLNETPQTITTTEPTTEQTTSEQTDEQTTTESNVSATTTGESTDTGVPGFGAALAVVALVAAAFVATRQ